VPFRSPEKAEVPENPGTDYWRFRTDGRLGLSGNRFMSQDKPTPSQTNVLPSDEQKGSRSRKQYPVTIDEEAIRLAVKGRADHCPNTVATIRDVKKRYNLPWRGKPSTDENGLNFIDKLTNEKVLVMLPKRVRTFLNMYDNGEVIDKQGNIKVREFSYTLDLSKAVRTPLPFRKQKVKAASSGEDESQVEKVAGSSMNEPAKSKAPRTKSLDMVARSSRSRRRGITGYEEEKAFLLSQPIDAPQPEEALA
jgi:hypothetical protein